MNGFHSENKCVLQKCTFCNPEHFLGGTFFALFYSEHVLKCNCYVNLSKKKGVQLHGDKWIFRCRVSLANRLFSFWVMTTMMIVHACSTCCLLVFIAACCSGFHTFTHSILTTTQMKKMRHREVTLL